MPSNRLGPSDRPMVWTLFAPSNECSTAVPSKTQSVDSMLFTTSSLAAM